MQQINDTILSITSAIANFCWSNFMIYVMFFMGIFFTIRAGWPQLRHMGDAFTMFFHGWKRTKSDLGKGELSPIQSVLIAIGGQIGIGNIAGPATAILAGGPGAVFWLWVSAFFGMGTISAEATAAQIYREVLPDGSVIGGPALYIQKAFPNAPRFSKFMGSFEAWLVVIGYGVACALAQGNTLAGAMEGSFGLPTWVTGIVICAIVLIVGIGGIKVIGSLIEKMVPVMAIIYLAGGLVVLLANIAAVPGVIVTIFKSAFTFKAAAGGAIGFTIKEAMRYGVARGLFSNEAGQGSTAHAHAVAKVKHPCDQGLVAMMSIVIDTFIVLTMSALIILATGANTIGVEGVQCVQYGFQGLLGNFGSIIVSISIFFFCMSTIIGAFFVGQQNWKQIFKGRHTWLYIAILLFSCIFGSITYVEVVFSICDCLNGPMVIVNLIALLGINKVIAKKWKEYNAGGAELDTTLNDVKKAIAESKKAKTK